MEKTSGLVIAGEAQDGNVMSAYVFQKLQEYMDKYHKAKNAQIDAINIDEARNQKMLRFETTKAIVSPKPMEIFDLNRQMFDVLHRFDNFMNAWSKHVLQVPEVTKQALVIEIGHLVEFLMSAPEKP
jgi:hypothetical protein